MNERAARVILHVDMDAFYVSVELLRRPELRGRPVVVGSSGPRGVVAAASYEARRFGLRSAMASSQAMRLCPHAVFLPGDHGEYAAVSAKVGEVFASYTPLVEPLSLDEAFLDCTGAVGLFGGGADIGKRIRQQIAEELQLPCSVGVAPNKFLAKLASEAAKPSASPRGIVAGRGVVVVPPGSELAFLHPLPVQALWGVGPATLERLRRLGVTTVGQLAEIEVGALVASLGASQGRHLANLAAGRDDRPVEPNRALKSIGHEETFAVDRTDFDQLRSDVVRLSDSVASRLRRHGGQARTVQLKVRFGSFETITRSMTVAPPVSTARAIADRCVTMLATLDVEQGVRLLGVSVTNFEVEAEQLSLDSLAAVGVGSAAIGPGEIGGSEVGGSEVGAGETGVAAASDDDWRAAEQAMDHIRSRFGGSAIAPASSVDANGSASRVVRRGQT